MSQINFIQNKLNDSIQLKKAVMNNHDLISTVSQIADAIVTAYQNGNKVILHFKN